MTRPVRYYHVHALQPNGTRLPVATLAFAARNNDPELIDVACALRSRKDDFRRERGRTIAEGRLLMRTRHHVEIDLESFRTLMRELGRMRREPTTYTEARDLLATVFGFDRGPRLGGE